MRKALLAALLLFCILFSSVSGSAQVLGDIAFTRYNSSNSTTDSWSFVVLRTGGLAAGTVLKFTDRGYAGNPSGGTCGTNSWGATAEEEYTLTLGAAAPYGRIIDVNGSTATFNHDGSSAGTSGGVALNLSAGGDQIIAYTGLQTAPTILAAIHMNYVVGVTSATNWDNVAAPSGTESSKPLCILNGTHGLFVTNLAGNDEVDNARIKSSVILSGNPATDRSRINNLANWDRQDLIEYAPNRLSGLPVDFTWIKAYEQSNAIQVDWSISLEEQVKDYTIERSGDGRTYSEIGTIAATGKTLYTFTDATPLPGTNYYRIRATELSENKKYSTIAIVNRTKTGKGIGVYPTLVSTKLFNLQIMNLPKGNYRLNIINASGQIVLSKSIMHAGGNSTQPINLPGNITTGMYRLTLDSYKATIVIQ